MFVDFIKRTDALIRHDVRGGASVSSSVVYVQVMVRIQDEHGDFSGLRKSRILVGGP